MALVAFISLMRIAMNWACSLATIILPEGSSKVLWNECIFKEFFRFIFKYFFLLEQSCAHVATRWPNYVLHIFQSDFAPIIDSDGLCFHFKQIIHQFELGQDWVLP